MKSESGSLCTSGAGTLLSLTAAPHRISKKKKKKCRVISYSVPTSTGIVKLHAAVETLGGVHQFPRTSMLPTCHLGGAAINVKLICVMMRASNKGRTLLLITDGPCEMSYRRCGGIQAWVWRTHAIPHIRSICDCISTAVCTRSDGGLLELDGLHVQITSLV